MKNLPVILLLCSIFLLTTVPAIQAVVLAVGMVGFVWSCACEGKLLTIITLNTIPNQPNNQPNCNPHVSKSILFLRANP